MLVLAILWIQAVNARILDPFLVHPLDSLSSPQQQLKPNLTHIPDPPDLDVHPLLLNLENLISHEDHDNLPPKIRVKRIPHESHDWDFYNPDSSSTSDRIFVTDNGDEESKTHSSGPWTPWSAESECSRPCGGGVAYQTRSCENEIEDVPSCSGPDTRYFSCNTHSCGDAGADFRAEQCSAFNSDPFEGRFYTWMPYTRAPNKCELNCVPQGERFYYRHKRKVTDGTPCGQDTVCVNGNCLAIDCDGVLGSRRRQDKCLVCGGEGSNCNTVQGVLDSNDLQVGYNDVLLIPTGATNILVREIQATNNYYNYLAIRNTSGHYYLNGNGRIVFPQEIPFAGTTFHYERKPHTFFDTETIRALGPITEAIYIVVLYGATNPGITFEYSTPRGVVVETEDATSVPTESPDWTEYAWIYDVVGNIFPNYNFP